MEKEQILDKLSTYGNVDVFNITETEIEIKITDGFTGEYEPTMQVGELILNNYPKFKSVKMAQSEIGLCHYIFV